MNSVVHPEPEILQANIRCKVDIEMEKKRLELEENTRKWLRSRPKLAPVVNAFEDLATYISVDYQVNIHISGDKDSLIRSFRILRGAGFKTDSPPPRKGENQWVSTWIAPNCPMSIYFNFTSTICRRVQTGTKMVEQAVYETVCGEIEVPTLEDEGAILTITAEDPPAAEPAQIDNDIPF